MRKSLAGAVLVTGLTFAPALDAVHAQDDATEEDDDGGKVGLFGLAGLLGLPGLAGLKRRNDNYSTTRRSTTGSTTGDVR